MLDLRPYRQATATLSDYLLRAGLIAPGVVLNKDGAFQRTLRFRGRRKAATPISHGADLHACSDRRYGDDANAGNPCQSGLALLTISQMAIQYAEALDRTFHALGDGSRRRMLATISRKGACSAGELAALFDSAQPTISKHLRVLEDAQLVTRRVEGRRHVFTLSTPRMKQARAWLERHLAFWEGSLNQLDDLLEELKQTEGKHG